MAYDPKLLQATLAEAAPLELDLTFRSMFGGVMAYANGKPFASLSGAGMALKFAGIEREALLALPGAAPLRYAPDQPPSKSYVLLPEAVFSKPDQLGAWVVRCISALPAKHPRTKA